MPRTVSEPAPEPEPVEAPSGPRELTLVEFITLVRAHGEMTAEAALLILHGAHASAEINLLGEMLMLADTRIAHDNMVVVAGLQTLIDAGEITVEGRDAIVANWPQEG